MRHLKVVKGIFATRKVPKQYCEYNVHAKLSAKAPYKLGALSTQDRPLETMN